MKRVAALAMLALFVLFQAGCIAVSAKEIHDGMRYEAVSTADGSIYVVDKVDLTARGVCILRGRGPTDP
jgi:hypothetical protein